MDLSRVNYIGNSLLGRLRKRIARGLIYENFGVDEEREYRGLVRNLSGLTYQEQCDMIERFSQEVNRMQGYKENQ